MLGNESIIYECQCAGLPQFQADFIKKNHGLLDKIKPIVEQHQASLSQLVLRWTIERQEIKISLAGARNAQKSTQNAKEIDLKLNKEELQSIDE